MPVVATSMSLNRVEAIVANDMEATYYKTWDNIGRRYLIKKNLDDEWRLSPTPSYCSTEGRVFDPTTGTYSPPPCDVTRRSPLPVFWDNEEGRWIFRVTIVKENVTPESDESESDEDGTADTTVGVDINAIRRYYF